MENKQTFQKMGETNMKNKFIKLQLFADGENGTETGVEGANPGTEGGSGAEGSNNTTEQKKTENQPKYTDEDLDRIIGKKFAEWQKKKEKDISEAERLSKMTTEEKNAAELKALRDEINGYKAAAAKTEMTKQARAMLQGENINVGDELVGMLIGEDAETTKASVESFVKLFKGAVESAVKAAMKSETPKTGGSSGLTKEQILAVANRAERQRLINENMNLFK